MAGLKPTLDEIREIMRPMFEAQRRLDDIGRSDATADLASIGVVIDAIGGNCPVQIEGDIRDAHSFYFRARGDAWQFHVYPKGARPFDDDIWTHEEDYGSWPDAGWMPQGEALAFCAKASRLFLASLPSSPEVPHV